MTDPVIFLHGRGLGPETLSEVASAFEGAELIAPTGGLSLRRGHTWFENVAIGIAREDSVMSAEERFLSWRASGPLNGRPALLCGFSNGGAFAAHLLMRHPAFFTGAALLSAPLVLPPWPAGALAGKNVFYGHGEAQDQVVGQSFYLAAESYLITESGCKPTVRRYDIGHAIEPPVIADLTAWYRDEVRKQKAEG